MGNKIVLLLVFSLLISIFFSACSKDTVNVELEVAKPNKEGNVNQLYLIKAQTLDGNLSLKDTDILPKEMSNRAIKLNIFHINDVHGNIMTFNKKGNTHNLAQMKKIVDKERYEANKDEAILWVSAGDDHIGSKFDELLGQKKEEFVESAVYKAYSEAGIDIVVLGNHEFDKGTAVLEKIISESAAFPVLASNIFDSKEDLDTSVAAICVINGLRIGVLGLTITSETKLGTSEDPSVYGIDPKKAVKKLVPLLDDYVDTFVVLSHIGYEFGDRYSIKEGDGSIAVLLSEITKKPSIVVGGHTHAVINENELDTNNVHNNIAVLQAGQYANAIGIAQLNIENNITTARVLPILSGIVSPNNTNVETEKDYDVEFQKTVIDPMVSLVEDRMNLPVGKTDVTMELNQDLNNADRYTGEAAMANFVNDAVVTSSQKFSTGKVDFSIFNGTGVRGLDLNSDVTYGTIYELFPYADTISVVNMTGRQLKEIIENNAARVVKAEDLIVNGGDLDPAGFIERGYINFSSGIRYEIKLGDTPFENKSQNITLNAKSIDDVLDKSYKVALSSYLVIGRGGWQGEPVLQGLPGDFIGYDLKTLSKENGHDLGLLMRSEIINYIVENSNSLIGSDMGVIKDGRVKILN